MANVQQETFPHKQHQSRLLNLPAELRNQIWEYVFGSRQYGLSFQLGPVSDPHRAKPLLQDPPPTSLLLVCKQTHEETNFMIVRCDDFAIDYQVPPSTFIAKMTDRQKAAIASIYIDDCGFNGMFRQRSNYWEYFLTNDADLEYEDHVPFAKLTGLRRIESRVWTWASRFP